MEAMKRLSQIKLRRRVETLLYYVFLIITVGAFLLFIPLHSRFLEKKSVSAPGEDATEMITHRETNATGERAFVDNSIHTDFVFWVKDLQSQKNGEEN